MPAEWEPHAATLLHWPTNPETWPGERLRQIEAFYVNLIREIIRFEPVLLNVDPARSDRVKECLNRTEPPLDLTRLSIQEHPVNDLWVRDCGPIMATSLHTREHQNEEHWVITNWTYNAWGGKYPPWEDDNRIPERIAGQFGLPVISIDTVLEGGAVETNGNGLLMTTESCLLNPNRNPGVDRQDMEQTLNQYLGARNVIWLESDLPGDDTDGHIDNIARFIDEGRVVLIDTGWNRVHRDELNLGQPAIQPDSVTGRNLGQLNRIVSHEEHPLELLFLPSPNIHSPLPTVDGMNQLPASYANFYFLNGGVLVPLYGDEMDACVMECFREWLPDREVVGIPCFDLIWGQGGLHCITQPLFGDTISDSYCS